MKIGQASTTKKRTSTPKNPIETGNSILDQILGNFSENDYPRAPREAEKPQKAPRQEFTVFNFREHREQNEIQSEIKSLMDSVKKEIKAVKESSSSLDSQLKEVEKHALNEMSEKPGVYHVRFLELVLELLRTIKMKMGESNTWLQAMMSKKKKRGSLFASLSKKKGTQYSLSQELQAARSIQ